MLLSRTIRLFLDGIGRRDEYELYLKKFQSDDTACFAVVCPDLESVEQSGDVLAFDLEMLHKLELHPLTLLQGTHARQMLSTLQRSGHEYHVLEAADSLEELISQIKALPSEGIRVLVDEQHSLEKLLSYIMPSMAKRIHFLRGQGALRNDHEELVPYHYLNKENKHVLHEDDVELVNTISNLFDSIGVLHVSVSSAHNLLREMFTVKGAGTLIKKGSKITSTGAVAEIDLPKLNSLIEQSFGKPLSNPDFVKQHISHFIIDEGYLGGALLEERPEGYYLSKFAVGAEARGRGLAQELWDVILDQAPVLFWRSKKDNPVNQWYAKHADGTHAEGEWSVFWRGVKRSNIDTIISYALDRPEDFCED